MARHEPALLSVQPSTEGGGRARRGRATDGCAPKRSYGVGSKICVSGREDTHDVAIGRANLGDPRRHVARVHWRVVVEVCNVNVNTHRRIAPRTVCVGCRSDQDNRVGRIGCCAPRGAAKKHTPVLITIEHKAGHRAKLSSRKYKFVHVTGVSALDGIYKQRKEDYGSGAA